MNSNHLSFSPSVLQALINGSPVVALESTIISHGMPYPDNFKTARRVEETIRSHGAEPATIAIIAGRPTIGLTESQMELIAKKGHGVAKVSRRDLAWAIANQLDGATTVSGTMMLAHMAGIKVFVTGGIGGVHRGGEVSMDVSADLTELGRTPVCVVCAGIKSILDIQRTLEVLETQGVGICGYQTDEVPAFFTPRSGFKAPMRAEDPAQVARTLAAGEVLGVTSGFVLAVPIPPDQAADGELVESATAKALQEAEARGVKGSQVTPFVLERVSSITGGKSLTANINLILNNAKVGARVAVEYASLQPHPPRPRL